MSRYGHAESHARGRIKPNLAARGGVMAIHQEVAFESAIEMEMLAAGWVKGSPADYDRALGLDTVRLLEFLQTTQPNEWQLLSKTYGATAPQKVVARIAKEIDARGTLDVLRNGVKDRGVSIRLAFFEPANNINQTLVARFNANVLSVTRQVAYELHGGKELDLVLFVNGLATATVELKNPLSGQNVEHAKKQYRMDREPKELLFAKRALVHFAVDPYLVFITTRLVRRRGSCR
jgi:type I restriction enzyme R subunit